ncbi:hypothetical protein Tco_0289613 [Tanacetum coccineum]
MKEKMNDPIAVANKQNCWTIDYKQINTLYKDFVPQKELSAEQKYFPSSFIPSDKTPNATSSITASMPRLAACNELQSRADVKDAILTAYGTSSRWRAVVIDRRDHREVGNEADGFYADIRKLYNDTDISFLKSIWPTQPLCDYKQKRCMLTL